MDTRPGPVAGSLRNRQKPAGSEAHNPTQALTSVPSSARAPAQSAQNPTIRHQTPSDSAVAVRNTSHSSPSPNGNGSTKHDDKTSPAKVARTTDTKKVTKTSSSSLKRAATITDDVKQPRKASKDELKSKNAKSDLTALVTKTTDMYNGLKSNVDELRNLVTCKICIKLLYEPYVTSCGHTYCYSCLSNWFINNRAKKTCPECRTDIIQAPAPAYLIRELVQLFATKPELLSSGETLEQHVKWSQEEAELVQQDKENTDVRGGGLFKGCFRPVLNPNQDPSDNVSRCPLCNWEVVDNVCEGCGFDFDGLQDDNFGGFSDMDGSEDLDADLEMDDYEGDLGYDAGFDDEDGNYADDDAFINEHSFAVRRWLAGGGRVPPYRNAPRRRAAHSAAGSRRSYSASLVSGMHNEDTDMGILEEEEEEDEDDSSMADFINDDEISEGASQVTTSTSNATPQPLVRAMLGRNRRVVESETSSASQTTEEDEDDEPPVAPGRRRLQSRAQLRANHENPSSEEDLQALLLHQGWSPLDQGSNDEDVDEDGDESDGQRTTVGWEPITNSNDRSRTGGSLTPTAGRINPPLRPPTRVRNRLPDGSRGVRPRSSVMSISTVNYEDGEADDDASDIDADSDIPRGNASLRPRSSRIRLRVGSHMPNITHLDNRPLATNAIDADGDDSSDSSSRLASGQLRARRRNQEYDPRISFMFAQHMTDMRQLNSQESNAWYDYLEQLRGATPVARPRTANRNRPPSRAGISVAAANTGNLPTPGIMSLNHVPTRNTQTPVSSLGGPPLRSPSRTTSTPNRMPPVANANVYSAIASSREAATTLTDSGTTAFRTNRESTANALPSGPQPSSPTHTRPEMRTSIVPPASEDLIERPPSRLPSRPPSAAGRRGSAGFAMPYPTATASLGLNFAARQFQAQNNNPFFRPRPRQSTQRLREQSSTATLRPRSSQRILRAHPSQVNVREGLSPTQESASSGVRIRASRNNLRSMPSQQRIHAQASSRNLRSTGTLAGAHGSPGGHAGTLPGARLPASSTSSRLTEDERRRRVNELIRSRQQELNTNPFTSGRRPSNPHVSNPRGSPAIQPEHTPSAAVLQNPTLPSAVSPTSLNRRRSARNINAAHAPAAMPGNAPPRTGFQSHDFQFGSQMPTQPMAVTAGPSHGNAMGGRPF